MCVSVSVKGLPPRQVIEGMARTYKNSSPSGGLNNDLNLVVFLTISKTTLLINVNTHILAIKI